MSEDTPAPEATPEPAPEAQPETPESAPAEGGEFNISDLPPQAQEYIHELREEAKSRRKEHEPYKQAFKHFNEEEQAYLLNLVDVLGVDEKAGAEAMQQLSGQLLGIDQAAEEIKDDPEIQEQAKVEGITPEQVEQIIAQKQQEAKLIAQVEAETKALGFEPGTQEAQTLWDLSLALKQPDLSKVAPLARQHLGIEDPEATPTPEPSAEEFPIPVTTQGSPTDAPSEGAPHPALGSQELRERVARKMQAATQPGQ